MTKMVKNAEQFAVNDRFIMATINFAFTVTTTGVY